MYSILHKKYSGYFGFTNSEISGLLKLAQLPSTLEETKEWYNGYTFSNNLVYNHWSIIKFIKERGELAPYWINASGNNLIKEKLLNANSDVHIILQDLMLGKKINQDIDNT